MTRPKGPAHTPPAPARIWALLASEASTAVIFRRGPSRWTRLYQWNTRTDEITPGSWFHGRLYEWMSDLSPDGQHLLYVAHNEARRRVRAAAEQFDGERMWSWTALCRPPWVKALGLWNASDYWSGGGVFTDNHVLTINHSAKALKALIEAKGFVVEGVAGDRQRVDTFVIALQRTGWRVTAWPERWRGMGEAHPIVFRKKALELRFISSPRHTRYVRYIWHGPEAVPLLKGASWADLDQQGRLVLAREGRLYARRGSEMNELINLNLHQPLRSPGVPLDAKQSSHQTDPS
ncbi:hypothetical protein GO986_12685 [Deinococcus sp. HMF7620]|uniref:Uncharacterized protein n=1 Tax=Deinococcus arboris TaxID=2682977 RepID=A0A7C9M9E0_9DEIO|nr:hypothetical protein [Deinococcus arboris]MVN87623.1 hypothetical protein [Deinococcus arboris]